MKSFVLAALAASFATADIVDSTVSKLESSLPKGE